MSAIHVHIIDITRSPFLAGELYDRLSTDERQRADRLKVADKRAQFIGCRSAMRQVLGLCYDCDPDSLAFTTNEHGKPCMPDGDWHFNISHSHRRMIMACSQDLPVGVDVELIDNACAFDALAKRYFAVDEYRAVMLHPGADARRAFYACWTAKEAFLKCLGTGIDRALDSFVVGSLQHLNANPRRVHGLDGPYDEYIHLLDAGRDYWASLACADEEPTLQIERHDLATLCV